MPFIGRDWRSPGEAWVKTESLGWQRMKIIESQLYPSCHQNPACSWPPRSEFGQHMATNCRGHNRDDRNSGEYRDCSSSGGSSDSSRGGSTSPSPTGSPEKNVHHIYPITISSPYGQYSCCTHHFESSSHKTGYYEPTDKSQSNAQKMSRSLSRESVRTGTMDRGHSMRYNSSCSDFRNSTTTSIDDQNYLSETPSSHEADDRSNTGSPISMRNGYKIADTVCESANVTTDNKLNHSPTNSQSHSCCCANSQCSQGIYYPKEPYVRTAPHCRISVRTREVAMYNTISEAFYRLDFCNAIHDIRRFNYICKLLHLLITQNLTSLGGCATRVLFTMLEQVAWEVSSNKRNIHVLKNLLNELRQMIQKYYCWGRPIGSSLLWQQHFDTIERISQIVDGIELSPPESDSAQITFDKLPVEMIREILLRLNDYRDLVNSAQASPVMRTMINGQYIWQQLCRYHFTDQQLKVALENPNGLFNEKKVGNIRGVKYARTASADGRTSFRNPVMHKSKNGPTTRQQIEQTSSRRNSRQKDANDEADSSSYVTRTIRIFDKESSSTTLRPTRIKKAGSDHSKQEGQSGLNNLPSSSNKGTRSNQDREVGQENRPLTSNRPSHVIDWERVFHQLRKKFDLKEEYADCLLLCRHCRCLFWKSFGHPCIKSDDHSLDKHCSNFSFEKSCPDANKNSRSANQDDRLSEDGMQSNGPQSRQSGNGQMQIRPSVASLSRNFDNRAQRVRRGADVGNMPQEFNTLNSQSGQQPSSQRSLLNILDARLRERNIRLLNRRPDEINTNNNGSPPTRPPVRRDEIVPKHVAISPQAFLKFFSL